MRAIPRRITVLSSSAGARRRRAAKAALAETLSWLGALFVIWLIYFSPRHVLTAEKGITYMLALGVLVLALRRPDRSLLILIVLLPFHGFLLSLLWQWGLPTSIARHLGAWKEVLALSVVIAGARSFIASGRRADMLDRLALGFVAIIGLYALVQPTLLPYAPSSTSIRLLGFRETAGFVLVLLGARHAPLGPDFGGRAARAVFITGTVVAGMGLFEAILSSTWNQFVVKTVGYTGYEVAILNTHPANLFDIRIYGSVGGVHIVRVGSVFLNALTLSWYLILPLAIGIERAVRRRASPLVLLSTAMISAALLLTQTRSGILAGLIVAALALAPAAGRTGYWRTQVVLLLAGLALVAVPAIAGSGLAKRVGATGTKSDQSSAGHIADFWVGLNTVLHHPLGQGLGTAAGVGQRFATTGDTIAENSYLNVGIETGLGPMLLFVVLTVLVVLRLRRASKALTDPLITATWAAGAGLAVSAWFLQTWLDFSVSWIYWGLAGAALGLVRHHARLTADELDQLPSTSGPVRLSDTPRQPAPSIASR